MKKSVSPMVYVSLAGFACTAVLAVFALFTVATRGLYNPNHIAASALPQTVNAVSAPKVEAVVRENQPDVAATNPAEPVDNKTPEHPKKTLVAASGETGDTPAADSEEEDAAHVYTDPPARSPEEQARVEKAVAALTKEVKGIDYERARFHRLHFKPAIKTASNEECLVCHKEIMTRTPRKVTPAGLKADQTLAWYQTLDTYKGKQQTFHYRHLQSDYAKQVMKLECTFCHKGNDPREENPDMQRGQKVFTASAQPNFTLRKMVNPSTTCLRCHGKFPFENMEGVEANWPIARKDIEDEDVKNGCLTCHGEGGFRPNRHNVTYLKAASIEKLAKNSSDVCFGCHGGRQWYRIAYPYPRHPWPDMDTEETPDWAKNRPATSDVEYQRKPQAAK